MHAVKWPPPRPVAADALEELYRQHHEMILRTAYRLTRNLGDAEDVLHGVFVKLMQREKPFGEDVNPGPYLHRAAVNAAIDILRRRKQIVPLEAVPPSREAARGEPVRTGLPLRAGRAAARRAHEAHAAGRGDLRAAPRRGVLEPGDRAAAGHLVGERGGGRASRPTPSPERASDGMEGLVMNPKDFDTQEPARSGHREPARVRAKPSRGRGRGTPRLAPPRGNPPGRGRARERGRPRLRRLSSP